MIYDNTTLLLMDVPPGRASDNLVDIYICQELQEDKSTPGQRKPEDKNHVQGMLKSAAHALVSKPRPFD